MLRNAVGGGRVSDLPDNFKRYKDVQLTVVSVARGWEGVRFPRQKSYLSAK